MIVNIWGNPRDMSMRPARVSLKNYLAGSMTLNAYRYGAVEMDDWLRIIRGFRSVLVYGYVSALVDVAAHVLDTGIRIANVRAVMTSAEKLHEPQRRSLEQAFGCKVYDQYGSREVPGIASECASGGMHLLTHSAYVEFVPDTDSGLNRLVVTCLTNRTMPFLRYEIGDYATPLEGNCPCGRGFPLMRMDIGRMVDCLVAPGGKRMYGTFFVRQMYGLNGVEAFQFRQREASHIDLFVVRGPVFGDAEGQRLASIVKNLERDLPGVGVSMCYVPEIPKTQGGKHRHVVCEVVL
jgi:phenylacetate-CoA ligase